MGGKYLTGGSYTFHGGTHHLLILYSSAVVGESRHVRGESGVIHKFMSHALTRDGGVGDDVDNGIAVDNVELATQVVGRIGGGVEVRHGAYGGEAAGSGSRATVLDSLLIGISRFAEMHVHINETGHKILPRSIDDLASGIFIGINFLSGLNYHSVADNYVAKSETIVAPYIGTGNQ